MKRALFAVTLTALAMGCDRFEAPPAPGPDPADQARSQAKESLTRVMKAAAAATATCAAGELLWQPDEIIAPSNGGEGSPLYQAAQPVHFSRPCIPEHCSPTKGDLDGLKAAAKEARSVVDASADLRTPSYQGFVAIAEAMVGFADVVGAARGSDATHLSGLSMHYATLAAAFRELVPGTDTALQPPSLVASLAVAEPGGDPCKGWRIPRLCDVRAVKVSKPIAWRVDPPCIEVEGLKK